MKVLIAATAALLIVTQANAADTGEVPHESVNISDLRQDTPQGLAALYHRLHAAAERVCSPLASYDRLNIQKKKCVSEAIERASAQVPELARYEARRRKVGHG